MLDPNPIQKISVIRCRTAKKLRSVDVTTHYVLVGLTVNGGLGGNDGWRDEMNVRFIHSCGKQCLDCSVDVFVEALRENFA